MSRKELIVGNTKFPTSSTKVGDDYGVSFGEIISRARPVMLSKAGPVIWKFRKNWPSVNRSVKPRGKGPDRWSQEG